MKKSSLLAVPLLMLAAVGQTQTGGTFPVSSVPAAAPELTAYLSGKSFHTVYANGTRVQSKYSVDGGLAASAPGLYDTGKWRTEEGKLCGSLRKSGEFCNDARFDAGVLYLRRMNGEIVRYEAE